MVQHQMDISCPHCMELYMRLLDSMNGQYQTTIRTKNLLECRHNIHSQFGEDGILGHIMSDFDPKDSFVVEVGANDGVWYSNIFLMVKSNRVLSLSIEGDEQAFLKLKKNYEKYPNAKCHNGYVSLESEQNLNNILDLYNVPKKFDLLSLDVDGNDFWIWSELKYDPKVVVVEYNSSLRGDITVPYDKNMMWDRSLYFGASATLFKKLGQHKGYDLVCVTGCANMIFLKKEINQGCYSDIEILEEHYRDGDHDEMTSEQKNKLCHINWEEFSKNL